MTDTRNRPSTTRRSPEETRRLAARGYGKLSAAILYFLGAYILLAPWVAPKILGWEMLTRLVGGEQVFMRIAVGLLFVYFATLTQEKYALKFLTQDIMHAMNMLLYGQDYRQHRATVTEQIKRLEEDEPGVRSAAHRVLTQMTGQAFPAEYEPWAAWWQRARSTFRLARTAAPPAAARPDRAGSRGEKTK